MAKKKVKKIKEAEDDLIFYLEYYKTFNERFKKRVVDKEIKELEEKIKNDS